MPESDNYAMRPSDTNEEAAETTALRAIAWTVSDEDRAARLLALTGLDAGALRAGVGDPAVQCAVLSFLEGHEADLVACAEALAVKPEALVRVRVALEAHA